MRRFYLWCWFFFCVGAGIVGVSGGPINLAATNCVLSCVNVSAVLTFIYVHNAAYALVFFLVGLSLGWTFEQ